MLEGVTNLIRNREDGIENTIFLLCHAVKFGS